MNIKFLTKIGIILGSVMVGIFALFLLLPFILNFFIDRYTPQIVGEINKLTGLSAGMEDVRIVTTPKLTAGLKVKKFELYTPNKEPIVIADNFQVKMSLLPILAKNVRVDVVQLENADITLKFNKNGELELLEYLPETGNEEKEDDIKTEPSYLPFGLKLSNHLPDIHVGKYKLNITDGKNDYILSGGKTDITDFIFNKSVKITGNGIFKLKDREQFNFNVKLFNKIMPDMELNELVFNPPKTEDVKQETEPVNIIQILQGLYDYNVTANAIVDLKTSSESIDGIINVSNISIIDLPKSNTNLSFKGNTINLNSEIFTAKTERSTLNGMITTGKKPYLDMNFKSDVDISNILNIVKKIALIFNIKDLQTLTASGNINSDFNIKSDTKTVKSSGFLKVPYAKLYYGLYNVGVDNINADVSLNNNNVNIKNAGFSILGQPLKLFGTISSDAVSDLHLTANNLSLKGLLIAVGQASLLKENPVYSGTISMDAIVKGPLDKINPIIKLNINNVDLKNIPADIRLKAPSTRVDITSDGKTFGGTAKSTNVFLINPALKVSIPAIGANIKEDVIEITQTPVTIEKIKTNISGKITNYLTEKIGLDFVSTGDIKSTLTGDMNAAKQTLNFVYSTTDISSIIIPMFNKSKMSFKGKLNITGNMTNPVISGDVKVPSISIPEIPVTMKDMDLKINGTILHGSGTVKEFASGGIKAQNCSADFALKGIEFYLNNLKGTSFDGKINGNIIYNLSNARTSIDFKGEGMNAEKAIEGAAGIRKALTGTLGFDTKLTLTVLDYNQMIKSMKGKLNFNVKNGAFGSIGRFEGLLGASNLVNNVLLNNTIASISNATGLATTAQFDAIEGNLSFSDGWANLNSVKSAGKSLCYYVTGKYNLLNGTTNVAILGRLDAPMVAKLGVLGELSAEKILGSSVAKIVRLFTTNPQGEKTSEIPALTNGSKNYKDFKVSFNGGVESKSSIKSFKWLSNPDMSVVDSKSTTEALKDIKSAVNKDVKETVDEVNNAIEAQKKKINDTKDALKTTADDFKNLFKSIKEKPAQTTETKPETTETVKPVTEEPAAVNNSAETPKTETAATEQTKNTETKNEE